MNLDIKMDINEIFEKSIDALSKSLNVAKEEILPILVQQAVAQAVYKSIILLVMILIALVIYRMYQKARKEYVEIAKEARSYSSDDEIVSIALLVVFGIWCIITFITFLCQIGDIVTGFMNPEYKMFKDVTEMISTLFGGSSSN